MRLSANLFTIVGEITQYLKILEQKPALFLNSVHIFRLLMARLLDIRILTLRRIEFEHGQLARGGESKSGQMRLVLILSVGISPNRPISFPILLISLNRE